MEIQAPQLRATEELYRSRVLEKLRIRSQELQPLVVEMYARGLSTRDIEESLKDKDGHCLISKSGVSKITASLNEEYERFCSRNLSG